MTRRSFLGALLVAIPGVKVLAAQVPIKKCSVSIQFQEALAPLVFTKFTNGSTTVFWGEKRCDLIDINGWTRAQFSGNDLKEWCDALFRWRDEDFQLRYVRLMKMKS